jgi:hypothetical protein
VTGEGAEKTPRIHRFSRRQWQLTVTMMLCYAVGYPLALTVAPVIGWSLVTIGGLFLFGLGVVTINRVHHQEDETFTRPQR